MLATYVPHKKNLRFVANAQQVLMTTKHYA